MPKLKDFEGKIIDVFFANPNHPSGVQRERVKLLNVDDAGIWAENQSLTNEVLDELNLPVADRLVTLFYPYAAIHAILVGLPGVSLSEKAFDVQSPLDR